MPSNAIQSYAGRLNKKDKVMTLTALSGEFPYSEFERLNINSNYGKLMRHNFYNDGLIFYGIDCAVHRNYRIITITPDGYEVEKINY